MSKFCMGCMAQYEDELNVCPHCGYVDGAKPTQALHMEPGSILSGRYIVGRALGFGGFGVTYLGWDALLEQKVAIKEYLPSEFSTRMPGVTQITVYNGDKREQFQAGLSQFVNEAKRLAKLNAIDGIVRVFDAFEENNTAYIVMECLEGETLAERLRREKTIPPEEAVAMLLPVISAMQQVHEQGLIHRDLAPDNLFIQKDGTVKVIDFGAARFATTSHSRSLTVIIKPGFSAEEQYRSRSDQGSYTDVYSMGAILYKMITGVTPPDALERRAVAESSRKDMLAPLSKYVKKISKNHENAILNAMNIRVEDRTESMKLLKEQLTSTKPVERVYGKIRRIDLYRWPLWAKLSAGAAAVAVAVFGALFATGVIGFDANLQTEINVPLEMTRVPSVISNTTAEADLRMGEANLLYTITGKEYSTIVPADYVLSQDINGGEIVMQNTNINITVSGGPQMVLMPDVMNISMTEAVRQLEEAGFAVDTVEEFSSVFAVGHVISQSVEADTEVAVGSLITLTVSKGADPDIQVEKQDIAVPNLVGKSFMDVLKLAEEYGFKIAVVSKDYSAKYPANAIISQAPVPETVITTGDTVSIVLSMGNEKARVPDVVLEKEQDANDLIQERGLNPVITYEYSDSVAAGLVISQNPGGNVIVEPGSDVALVVSKGSVPFAMPNVVGMSETDARKMLTDLGLVIVVEYNFSDEVEKNAILSQDIPADAEVTRGTTVTLVISTGEKPQVLPDVVDKNIDEIRAELEALGFVVSTSWTYDSSVGYGKIISQTPAAGTTQPKGATVVLTVSMGRDSATGITIVKNPSKRDYYTGDTLNTAGLTLKVTHKSGWVQEVTSGFSCSPTTLNTAGTQTITVTYDGCSASFTVNVKQAVLQGIAVEEAPYKTDYMVGDTIDLSGLTLLATYNFGTRLITSGFTCSPMTLTEAGYHDVTVYYEGFTATFVVYAEERPTDSSTLTIDGLYCEFGYRDWLETTGLIAGFHLSSNYLIQTYDIVITDASGKQVAYSYGCDVYEYDLYCEFAFTGIYFTSGATYTCTITTRDASGATRSSSCTFVG